MPREIQLSIAIVWMATLYGCSTTSLGFQSCPPPLPRLKPPPELLKPMPELPPMQTLPIGLPKPQPNTKIAEHD